MMVVGGATNWWLVVVLLLVMVVVALAGGGSGASCWCRVGADSVDGEKKIHIEREVAYYFCWANLT